MAVEGEKDKTKRIMEVAYNLVSSDDDGEELEVWFDSGCRVFDGLCGVVLTGNRRGDGLTKMRKEMKPVTGREPPTSASLSSQSTVQNMHCCPLLPHRRHRLWWL
ncbi:hypothetical protein L1049_017854 [Liquidambar formosana]|uniref:Uncharacterized protein n=1 Tax=Liquidambar formosana TaxID=63359 RepID=A0AAP0NGR4_LIQFO